MGKILTETITGSDHPADNLLCISNMLRYIQFSIPITCDNQCCSPSKEDTEGLSSILSFIEHDIRALSEIVELKSEKATAEDA